MWRVLIGLPSTNERLPRGAFRLAFRARHHEFPEQFPEYSYILTPKDKLLVVVPLGIRP